jgi:bacillithiol system protein YtxJ
MIKKFMNWIKLQTLRQLEDIKNQSQNSPVVIFKHSTRCSTSRMTLERLERTWDAQEMAAITPYFLDLLTYRQVSNEVADSFGVEHESPQVLVISKGESVLDLSHFEIDYSSIRKVVKN